MRRLEKLPHEHYCSVEGHDHRWKCTRVDCLLHLAASCYVCRCGKEMIETMRSELNGTLDYKIYACPLRADHIGHDSKVLNGPPAWRAQTPPVQK